MKEGRIYELALFAGAGGGILGGILCNHVIVGAVEYAEYPRKVLLQRQRDGILDEFPIWDDVRTFRRDNPETKEYIDGLRAIADRLVISGGFPCQDISCAGKGAGIDDGTRSGLWVEMCRIISEIRPRYAFIENAPTITIRGGTRVVADLAEMGYDCKWGVIGANAAGFDHKRARFWMVANNSQISIQGEQVYRKVGLQMQFRGNTEPRPQTIRAFGWQEDKPEIFGTLHGVPDWVGQSSAIGNAQVPIVAKMAWDILDGK